MSWGAVSKKVEQPAFIPLVEIEPDPIDWDRLVVVDFETYWDQDYTLRKLSTSEYVRDARFKAQMVGIKIGNKATKVYPAARVKAALQAIPWTTHSLLAHHAQFDGFIMSHHYGIHPKKIYCTLSMARALHSNDIGAGLDEVSKFYGGLGKTEGVLEQTKGVLNWPKALVVLTGTYCANDVDECLRVFKLMWPRMPREEMDVIDMTCRMFTDPVLKVDIPRVKKELAREIAAKRELMLAVAEQADRAMVKLTKAELNALGPARTDEDIRVRKAKKLIGSAAFADLLRAEGIEPPVKISPAYFKNKDENKKWAYAFAKTDLKFIELQEHPNEKVRMLVEARLAVKSNTNETRAGRFLEAGKNGMPLPVYLKYAAALTLRMGGGNKMNMQNLKRGGELRKSIQAPRGHVIVVVDSGQIEARTNAWLWGEHGLLEEFRTYDAGEGRDPYCMFGDIIYGRTITKADKDERFVGKVGILGLGYQMGAPRFQKTLALGLMGPPIHLELDECERIVRAYRRRNSRIQAGWNKCQQIIEEMAHGITGSYKCISWSKETIHLPNGMRLHYPGLHDARVPMQIAQRMDPDSFDEEMDMTRPQFVYQRKDQKSKLYGALLVENIVQCLARLIVIQQTLNVSRKYRVVMSTHDEAALLVKENSGQKALEFSLAEFKKPLPWCTDLPLNADGSVDVFYSK